MDAPKAEVLAHRVIGEDSLTGGASLATLDVRDRTLDVPVSIGDGGLRLLNPFSHGDLLAIGPLGEYVVVVRRPTPDSSGAFLTVDRRSVLEDRAESFRVPYTPRALDDDEVREWAEGLEAVRRMVDLGAFSGYTAAVAYRRAPRFHAWLPYATILPSIAEATHVNGLARYTSPGPLRPGKFRLMELIVTCSLAVETPGPALMQAPQPGARTSNPASRRAWSWPCFRLHASTSMEPYWA